MVRVCCFRSVFHIRYENNNESRGYWQEGKIFGSGGVVGRDFVSTRCVQKTPLNIKDIVIFLNHRDCVKFQ